MTMVWPTTVNVVVNHRVYDAWDTMDNETHSARLENDPSITVAALSL